ncbi:hypothetical protein L4D20_20915 [Vibrio kyushuensis]|uniref:putative adhesin n=1 Tax=Vibrio kyushuensis TaxID=2910249 RepID=UPI003D0AD28E
MTLRLYINGHGAWQPNDGYVKVPKNCTFVRPIGFGKTLLSCDARYILAGDWKKPPEVIRPEYALVPNYTWSPITPAERKADLNAFEWYRKKKNSASAAEPTPLYYKSIRPKNEPAECANVTTRKAPDSQDLVAEEYKPGHINKGDTIILYRDKNNDRDASALISCPTGHSHRTLSDIFSELDDVFRTFIKNFDHIEIHWVCCQALSLNRVHKVEPILNFAESDGGFMTTADVIRLKKKQLDANFEVNFTKKKSKPNALPKPKPKAQLNNACIDKPMNIKAIKNMLLKSGLAI